MSLIKSYLIIVKLSLSEMTYKIIDSISMINECLKKLKGNWESVMGQDKNLWL